MRAARGTWGRALGAASVAAGLLASASVGAQTQNARPGMVDRPQQPTFIDQEMAGLHALDKIAARVSQMWVPVGGTARFGRLVIDVKACRKRPPEEPPESAAFLEIADSGRDGTAVAVFRGWMFASSPSLSAMEHPLYDIWLAGCMTQAEAAAAEALARSGGVEDMGEDAGSRGRPTATGSPLPYARTERR